MKLGIRPRFRVTGLVFVVVSLWAVPTLAQQPEDPFEGFNRKVFAFNDAIDSWVLRPVAKGYDRVTPDPVQRRIGNVFDNLETPIIALNQFLQGKPRAGVEGLTRFFVNSTVGVAGIFDVASANGLPKYNEDYGQTLARWTGEQGPFLVIPFRGPATTTHAVGMVFSTLTSPLRLLSSNQDRVIIGAVDIVHTRAELLSAEQLISGDEYLFIRDAYLQSRDYEIKDGEIEEDPFLDEDF